LPRQSPCRILGKCPTVALAEPPEKKPPPQEPSVENLLKPALITHAKVS
jgi:hypothetical protein